MTLVGLSSDAVRIDWSPTLPSTTEVTFEIDSEWKLESLRLVFDDALPYAWDGAASFDGTTHERRRLRWRDEPTAIDASRVLEGERKFLELVLERDVTGSTFSACEANRENSGDGKSLAAGKRVAFHWNAEEAFYEVEPRGENALDAGQRARLTFDDVGAALAPGRAMSPGQAWRCDGRVLGELLEPGGAFEFESPGDGLRPWASSDWFAHDEQVRVEFARVFEDEGGRVAQLHFTAKSKFERDRSGDLGLQWELGYFTSRNSAAVSERVDLEVAGEVFWDLERNRARSIDARFVVRRELTVTLGYGRLEAAWSGVQRVRGSWRSPDESERAVANADDDDARR